MTKEEQELLYKELSARLYYGVWLEGNPGDPELLTGIEGLPTDNWVTLEGKVWDKYKDATNAIIDYCITTLID